MEQQKQPFSEKLKNSLSGLLVSIIAFIATIPLFVSLYQSIPIIKLSSDSEMRIDHILLFGVIYIAFYLVILFFSRITFISLGIGFVLFLISSLFGFFSFKTLYYNYASFVYSIKEDITPYEFKEKKDPFAREALLVYAIDYNSAKTREVASNWAVKNFNQYQSVIPSLPVTHALSIFKEVRTRWNYIYDPKGEDLYVKSSNTLKLLDEDDQLKGDCDDYSITMAALIKAVGGEVQLVRTIITNPDSTQTGHIYPEVKIGTKKDLETVAYLIKNQLFIKESKGKPIYYYIDNKENVWLNFDYFDHYPGGKYPSNVRISVLKI